MEILKVIVWPLSVIIIVVIIILLLRKSILNLLERVSSIKYGNIGAEIAQSNQGNSFLEQNNLRSSNVNIDKALGLFSSPTVDRAKNLVDKETGINEIVSNEEKVDVLYKYSQALFLILSFERIYNLIFGSQIYLLEFVNANSTYNKDDLRSFYDDAKEKNPSSYDGYSYDEYLNFLTTNELITLKEDSTYSISWLGRDFLKYLIETGKTSNKRL